MYTFSMTIAIVSFALSVYCLIRLTNKNEDQASSASCDPNPQEAEDAAAVAAPPVLPPAVGAGADFASPADIPGEVIAAISAAVASVMEQPYVITGISPADVASAPGLPQYQRPAWGFAAVQHNTKPF